MLENLNRLFADRILRLVGGLVVGVWIERYLGPEQFGMLNYALAFVLLFGAIAKWGIDQVVIRDLTNFPEKQGAILRTKLAELAGMMQVFQKPFAAKGMLFNYNIPFLDSVLDKVLFVQIRRDPEANVASVLDARRRQLGVAQGCGTRSRYRKYGEHRGLDPITQVAGQIYYIDKAVTKGLSKVSESRKLVVGYEDFCEDPQRVFVDIVVKLGDLRKSY